MLFLEHVVLSEIRVCLFPADGMDIVSQIRVSYFPKTTHPYRPCCLGSKIQADYSQCDDKSENKENKCEENSLEKLEGLDRVSRTDKQVFQKIIRGGGTGAWKERNKNIMFTKDKTSTLSDANNNSKNNGRLLVE